MSACGLVLAWQGQAGAELEAGTPTVLVSVSLGQGLMASGWAETELLGPQEQWVELFTFFSKAKAELLCNSRKKYL